MIAPILLLCAVPWSQGPIQVGSKGFTESVILGEVVAQLLTVEGMPAEHRAQLGGTRILWDGLVAGELDVYVEYTGTLREEIFAGRAVASDAALAAALRDAGVRASRPLGFDNTYALGMLESFAAERGITRISDLVGNRDLAFGFSNEFMERDDGWPSLSARYGLPHTNVTGLDHDLAYRGLAAGDLHVIDLYATDAKIRTLALRVLTDDLEHFPPYAALVLWRADLEQRTPGIEAVLARLEGRIDEPRMSAMNARVEADGESEAAVAAAFLRAELGLRTRVREERRAARLLRLTGEHLFLVGVSLAAAILVGIPLGVLAALRRRLGRGVLGVVGVVQTIPALVLFVVFIPYLGIGRASTIAALFLYTLLPIVRGTYAGLAGVPRELVESAIALGLSRSARLRLVELPMAMRSILAGIQTAAVIDVGLATLGAIIGAGGYGQPILTGIRRNDPALLLEGAVPAAVLALLVQALFEWIERRVVPRGLRLETEGLG